MPGRQDVVALVTAAGASSRMGRPKALVPWPPGASDAAPLVVFQITQLAGFREVIVVTGAESLVHQPFPPHLTNARKVHNPGWASGRSSSLEVGARALPEDAAWVLIVAVDQPLTPSVVDALLAAGDADDPAPIRIPTYDGRKGHPVLLPGHCLAALRHVSTFDQGLRGLVQSQVVQCVPVATPAIHLDLNAPSDLAPTTPPAQTKPERTSEG